MLSPNRTALAPHRRPSQDGRALLLAAVAVGLALVLAWVGLRAGRDVAPEGATAAAPVTPAGAADATADEGRPEALSTEREAVPEPERSPGAAPSVEDDPAADGERALREALREAPERSPEELELDMDARMARMRGLLQGSDEERLALAREILAEEPIGPTALRALDVLAELDPASVAGELERLLAVSDDPRSHSIAVAAIRTAGRKTEALNTIDLGALFDRGSNDVQIAAASVLESRGDDSLVRRYQEQFLSDLSSDQAQVRVDALRNLSQLHSPSNVEHALPLLDDPDENVRLEALRTVAMRPDPATVEHIRALLDDESDRVRRMAERMVQAMDRRSGGGR